MSTTTDLTIKATELFEFRNFTDWVNNATKNFKPHKFKPTVCIASDGSVCHIGEDFMIARDWKLFPIKVYSLERTAQALDQDQKLKYPF